MSAFESDSEEEEEEFSKLTKSRTGYSDMVKLLYGAAATRHPGHRHTGGDALLIEVVWSGLSLRCVQCMLLKTI